MQFHFAYLKAVSTGSWNFFPESPSKAVLVVSMTTRKTSIVFPRLPRIVLAIRQASDFFTDLLYLVRDNSFENRYIYRMMGQLMVRCSLAVRPSGRCYTSEGRFQVGIQQRLWGRSRCRVLLHLQHSGRHRLVPLPRWEGWLTARTGSCWPGNRKATILLSGPEVESINIFFILQIDIFVFYGNDEKT